MILEPCTSSGEKSASALISSHPGLLMAIDLLPPASGAATLVIYDNNAASASGTVLFECSVSSGTASSSINMSMARYSGKGLYAVLTGTTTYVVGYTVGG